MRFRIWHLLALMVFVALSVRLAEGLLFLEAQDHPWKPQETIDVIAFHVATATILGFTAWLVVTLYRKRTTA
jgi:hypothetical protein